MLSPDPLPLSLFRPPIVLVVESRTSARTSICRLLRALGYDGRMARDGAQALRMLRQHPTLYQLVLTNTVLPDMDGGHLARLVASAWPDTRVMLIAEYAPTGAMATVLAAHPDLPVLDKPFGFRELYEAVCRLVGPPRAAVPLMGKTGPRARRRTRISVP
ncbi:MAG TPA: response regulator [Gemmatimonadales bacterium]|nr:response regulator [Gemmatimonadales bacterium]